MEDSWLWPIVTVAIKIRDRHLCITDECRKMKVSGTDKNCIIMFWHVSRKCLARCHWIPNSRMASRKSLIWYFGCVDRYLSFWYRKLWEKIWQNIFLRKRTYQNFMRPYLNPYPPEGKQSLIHEWSLCTAICHWKDCELQLHTLYVSQNFFEIFSKFCSTWTNFI